LREAWVVSGDLAPGPENVDPLGSRLRGRLLVLRSRVSPWLVGEFDDLMARMRLLSDPAALSHPLAQPLVQFPAWVSAAVDHGPGCQDRLDDMVEATVTGYLYVRVHDDRLDDDLGDATLAMFLADSFLIRHQVLMAQHVGTDPRFWELFQAVADGYADAMLLERLALKRESRYDSTVFDAVLNRSQPLVLPGAALLSVADRWELLPELQAFVRYTVRSGQLVDDLMDCLQDLQRNRYTWVVRRLGGEQGRQVMLDRLVGTGVDEVVNDVVADLDSARAAAEAMGMADAVTWTTDRRRSVIDLRERLLLSQLFG
jgi:hypothetical protein